MGAYDVAQKGGSFSQITGAFITGSLSGFFKTNSVIFKTSYAFYSHLVNQTMQPDFKGLDFSQALMNALLSGANLPNWAVDKLIKNKVYREILNKLLKKEIVKCF